MLVPNRQCPLCGLELKAGEFVIRVEQIYRVGKVHVEATEHGNVAHWRCP